MDKRIVMFRNVVLAVVILGALGVAMVRRSESQTSDNPDRIAALAQCLTDKGVKMYGASWCSHCQRQKKAFGKAVKLIDYVECAVPGDPRAQSPECTKAGVTSYPTWQFALGERFEGELDLAELAERSGCPWHEMTDGNETEIEARPTITVDGEGPEDMEIELLPEPVAE